MINNDLNKFKLAIFDFDGTIIDSMPMWKNMASSFVSSLGYTPFSTLEEETAPLSMKNVCKLIKERYKTNNTVDELVEMLNQYVASLYYQLDMKTHIVSLIKEMYNKNIYMIILSQTSKVLIENSLKINKLDKYFKAVISNNDLGLEKSNGDSYIHVIECLGFNIDDSIIFEDAYYAIKGALMRNLTVCAVLDDREKENQEIIKKSCAYYL